MKSMHKKSQGNGDARREKKNTGRVSGWVGNYLGKRMEGGVEKFNCWGSSMGGVKKGGK